MGQRHEVNALNLQGATHRAIGAYAERPLHCRARRGVQTHNDLFTPCGHKRGANGKIEPHVAARIKGPEATIVVFGHPALHHLQRGGRKKVCHIQFAAELGGACVWQKARGIAPSVVQRGLQALDMVALQGSVRHSVLLARKAAA